ELDPNLARSQLARDAGIEDMPRVPPMGGTALPPIGAQPFISPEEEEDRETFAERFAPVAETVAPQTRGPLEFAERFGQLAAPEWAGDLGRLTAGLAGGWPDTLSPQDRAIIAPPEPGVDPFAARFGEPMTRSLAPGEVDRAAAELRAAETGAYQAGEGRG